MDFCFLTFEKLFLKIECTDSNMESVSTPSNVESGHIPLNAELLVYSVFLKEIFYNFQHIFKVVRYWEGLWP